MHRLNYILSSKHLLERFSHVPGWEVNAGFGGNSAALGKGPFPAERTGAPWIHPWEHPCPVLGCFPNLPGEQIPAQGSAPLSEVFWELRLGAMLGSGSDVAGAVLGHGRHSKRGRRAGAKWKNTSC